MYHMNAIPKGFLVMQIFMNHKMFSFFSSYCNLTIHESKTNVISNALLVMQVFMNHKTNAIIRLLVTQLFLNHTTNAFPNVILVMQVFMNYKAKAKGSPPAKRNKYCIFKQT